jgi:hypothetical protein
MPCAMPDEYKYEGDPVTSYRKYYLHEKLHLSSDITRFVNVLDIDTNL